MDELFILVRDRSPCASMADVLFALYRQMLLYVVGVAVWVAVQTCYTKRGFLKKAVR